MASINSKSSIFVKRVPIRSYSAPYFHAFGLNTERYGVSFQCKSGKIPNRITPNTDTLHEVTMNYLTGNSILYRYQSGFYKNDPWDTFLWCFPDKILTGISSGLLTGITLINLQKVFDTINHHILLKKHLLFNVSII